MGAPLKLRTFNVPADVDTRLAERALSLKLNKADLARQFVEELLESGENVRLLPNETAAPLVLRSYHIPEDLDAELTKASRAASRAGSQISKSHIFRAALMRGLGAPAGMLGVAARASQKLASHPKTIAPLVALQQIDFGSTTQWRAALQVFAVLHDGPRHIAVLRNTVDADVDTIDKVVTTFVRNNIVRRDDHDWIVLR